MGAVKFFCSAGILLLVKTSSTLTPALLRNAVYRTASRL